MNNTQPKRPARRTWWPRPSTVAALLVCSLSSVTMSEYLALHPNPSHLAVTGLWALVWCAGVFCGTELLKGSAQ